MTTYTLIWTAVAAKSMKRMLSTDPQLAKDVRGAVRPLMDDPYPDTSTQLGVRTLRRLRAGSARIVFEIDETHRSVTVLTVGRVAG